ncbi:energy-coupled thiamine transporter ThiT [Iocasia frigidifontis]|uniref:Energy-coupled thiamine transporter ThiT n=1 Tax=Iocasia fonsfrigidae TaxID=2682810 RepID=A0A8A7KGZ2_9FIRM|nr:MULTISPECIES: energy-coupled thiamine transporter ThiT [Halanaerobiaceae]AZO95221.1 energy-coupled thiamine transporter ThiT [Halocella sp. SP3-1]QTL98157.1 energy-coupled thiamine transporter ThiT [Iocasia fonsfrigidae]
MPNKRVRMMTEMGLAVALSVVLNFFRLWKMPQGGSVSLEMMPILIIALRWGGFPGMLTGFIYGLAQLMFDAYIVHPVQLLLDYPVAYMLLGLAGFIVIKNRSQRLFYCTAFAGVLIGGLGRFLSHLLSGVIFFGHYAPEGQNVWLYSTIYNGSFILPSLIVSFIIIIPLYKALDMN